MKNYYFDDKKRFIIEDYHKAKPFSSFLPGIAGEKGIPIWAFYVNRGQGISGFGIQDKNSPIMEFFPANTAYQYVKTYGFRTLIKLVDKQQVIEPFNQTSDDNPRMMAVEKHGFSLSEKIMSENLSIDVTYSTVVEQPLGGLIRRVVITNTGKEARELEVVDGMPAVLPYGVENTTYKEMSNLMRSWMEVQYTDTKVPFYKFRSSSKDESVVSEINQGNFYLNDSINDDSVYTIYDPKVIFGYRSDLIKPVTFESMSFEEIQTVEQVSANKVPSAFQLKKTILEPGEACVLNSVIGYGESYDLIKAFSDDIQLDAFVSEQIEIAESKINSLCEAVNTRTGIPQFDQYMSQCYLDNVLRGGIPKLFAKEEGNHVYHLYSRKHGDQEREYNFFSLNPSYYSQGNGNYRDVNQNRRSDLLFEPKVYDFNIWMFFNMVQMDGYNPLSVVGTYFVMSEENRNKIVFKLHTSRKLDTESSGKLSALLEKEFTPGDIYTNLLKIYQDEEAATKALELILQQSKQEINVEFGEGFWSDHFTYNYDLIENFMFMYPDKMSEVLLERKDYKIFNAPEYVLPRDDKYGLTSEGKIRQYKAIKAKSNYSGKWMIDKDGEIVYTNLFNKIFVLILTKYMNLDSHGMGIEMEGDKPGWNDAMNGLPGLFGSGMSETVELLRLVEFLIDQLEKGNAFMEVEILSDIYDLSEEISAVIQQDSLSSFERWSELNKIKEIYREKTREVVDSKTIFLSSGRCATTLKMIADSLEEGISKAKDLNEGLLPTYFTMDVTKYTAIDKKTHYGLDSIRPESFEARALPSFLEAPARYLKVAKKDEAKKIYEVVKQSGIYDQQLGMYKTSESLEDETIEIGRIRAFTPGWLERESVFMHMTYKYLLGTLKAGLYDEFYEDIKTNMVPFMNPEVYGRPTTENSSFIASSVNPDPSVVGQGFVARLSGSTAEMLNIWSVMMIGDKGFQMNEDDLTFTFDPILHESMFDESGHIIFRLFSHTRVIYNNPLKKKTYGEEGAKIATIIIDGDVIDGNTIKGILAEKLRNQEVQKIEVYFE